MESGNVLYAIRFLKPEDTFKNMIVIYKLQKQLVVSNVHIVLLYWRMAENLADIWLIAKNILLNINTT